MAPNVRCFAGEATANNITNGVAGVIPLVFCLAGNLATGCVTGGVAIVTPQVFYRADRSTAIAGGITNIQKGMGSCSGIITFGTVTVGVTSVVIMVCFFGMGNPFPRSVKLYVLGNQHCGEIPQCAVFKLPANKFVICFNGILRLVCNCFNLYLHCINSTSAI